MGQFEGGVQTERLSKLVAGIPVTIVEIQGTYQGGMMPGMGSESAKPRWTMRAAIIETAVAPYFFKLVGPNDSVAAARNAFDRMIDTVRAR